MNGASAALEPATASTLARTRALAWTAIVAGTIAVDRLTTDASAPARMLALIGFGVLAFKLLMVVEARSGAGAGAGDGGLALSPAAWAGYLVGWPGMAPRLFAARRAGALPGAAALVRRGIAHALVGALLIVAARLIWQQTGSRFAAFLILLPGLSLIVHFGVCDVLAGAWRQRGVACDSLFRAPWHAQSLGEFWGRRWNLAFSEMTTVAVYRPLATRFGRAPALLAAFALSGLLHELAISLPVRAGFGLPFLYFILHGALVLAERALTRAGRPIRGSAGRAWTLFWLVAPMPLLFHRAFLTEVIGPVIGIPHD